MSNLKHTDFTPTHCRVGRAALRIGVRELARMSGLTSMTVTKFENGRGEARATTKGKLLLALEQKGIKFFHQDDYFGVLVPEQM